MGILIDALQESVGTVKKWVRPSAATPLPPNFVILDGSTLVDPDSPFNGMVMKDTRGKFIQGHPTLTNANFAADTTYHFDLGGVIPNGGSATVDLSHDHVAGAHIHPIGSHSHVISGDGSHAHNAPFHSHSVGSDGNHTHAGSTGSAGAHIHNSDNVVTPGHNLIAGASGTYTDSQGAHTHDYSGMSGAGSHSHGGGTGGAGGATDAQGVHSHGGVTGGSGGNTAAGSGNTGTSLGVIDKTPPWWGFVILVKVK